MRVLITLVLTISLVSTAMATRLFAQIALPPVQLPDASRTLPSLPNLGTEPLIAVRRYPREGAARPDYQRCCATIATASSPTATASPRCAAFSSRQESTTQ